MAVSLKELNPKGFPLTKEMEQNLAKLHVAINIVRSAYGQPMIVTSGVRSIEDHRRIYFEIAKRKGMANPRIPMGSMHLRAAACDIADRTGELYNWCKANNEILEQSGLYCEEGTRGWVHFQILPFGSYKPGDSRWFLP